MVFHLLAECQYTKKNVWSLIASWTVQPTLSPQQWRPSKNTWHWWTNITFTEHVPQKAIRSLSLLVIWEIWRQRNARVFTNHETSAVGLLAKIKNEAAAWVSAGVKGFRVPHTASVNLFVLSLG
jgi:hypothetical protein